jgi:hypothetical protein
MQDRALSLVFFFFLQDFKCIKPCGFFCVAVVEAYFDAFIVSIRWEVNCVFLRTRFRYLVRQICYWSRLSMKLHMHISPDRSLGTGKILQLSGENYVR